VSAAAAVVGAAAGVAVGHAVLPDHWVPLSVLARTERSSLREVARLAGLAGVAHVVTSLLLGGVVIAVGLSFRAAVEGAENLVVGAALVITGVVFLALDHEAQPHHEVHGDPIPAPAGAHRSHPHEHASDARRQNAPRASGATAHDAIPPGARRLVSVLVPFGAAASPDLTILPVFLAATAIGALASIATVVTFSLVTILTIVGLTVGATLGGRSVREAWLERWGTTGTALVLIVIGGLVLGGVL